MTGHASVNRVPPCPICGSTQDWVIESWYDEEAVDARCCGNCGAGWIGEDYPEPGDEPDRPPEATL